MGAGIEVLVAVERVRSIGPAASVCGSACAAASSRISPTAHSQGASLRELRRNRHEVMAAFTANGEPQSNHESSTCG
jgi:hypothetical protein